MLNCSPFFEGWPAKRFLIFYLAPILSIAAIWLSLKIGVLHQTSRIEIAIDGIIFSLGMARFIVGDIIPISGHMLFFAYTFITVKNRWFKIITFLLLLETSYFKLFVWNDSKTWLNGLILGIIAGAIHRMLELRNKTKNLVNENNEN